MEFFVAEGYTKGQLVKLNQCRMYLKALRLSDIMNSSGKRFTSMFNAQPDPSFKSKYLWSGSSRPGSTAIKLWKSALRKTFGLKQGITDYKLGHWLYSPLNTWIWFYKTSTELVYQRFGLLWKVWKKTT